MDPSQLLKGVLDLAVLAVLAGRLFQQGKLTSYVVPSDEGPHRKYYALNRAGHDLLAVAKKRWVGFAAVMESLLKNGRNTK